MGYRETADEFMEIEITELEPAIWEGVDCWLAEWKEE